MEKYYGRYYYCHKWKHKAIANERIKSVFETSSSNVQGLILNCIQDLHLVLRFVKIVTNYMCIIDLSAAHWILLYKILVGYHNIQFPHSVVNVIFPQAGDNFLGQLWKFKSSHFVLSRVHIVGVSFITCTKILSWILNSHFFTHDISCCDVITWCHMIVSIKVTSKAI